jgi:hypothetical protein
MNFLMKRNFFTKSFAVLLFVLFCPIVVFAQLQPVSSYNFSSSAGTYTPITGGTVLTTTPAVGEFLFVAPATPIDQALWRNIPMPFCFYYNNVITTPISSFGVQSNGFVMLQTSASTNVISAIPISSATTSVNNLLSAFGANLRYRTDGEIRYETIGTAPFRTLVVQFSNMERASGTLGVDNGDIINFQIRMSETTNVIEFVYGTVTLSPTVATPATVQVGLKGQTNTVYNNRTTTTDWAATTAGAANSASMSISSTVFPASGQTYTWRPNCPILANSTGVLSLSSTSACGASAAVTLTDTGYEGIVNFQISTDGGVTWSNTCPTNQTVNTTPVTQTVTLTAPSTQIRAAVSCGGTGVYTAPQTFTLSSAPSVLITPSPDVYLCSSEVGIAGVQLTASSAGSYDYTWSATPPASPFFGIYTDAALTTPYTGTVNTTVYVSPSTLMVYTLTGTGTGAEAGCFYYDTQMIELANPAGTATAANATICANAPNTLGVTLLGNIPATPNPAGALPSGYPQALTSNPADDDIGRVQFAGIDNYSSGYTAGGSSINLGAPAQNIYTSFLSVTGAVVAGSNYNLTVTQVNAATFYTCHITAFFDWNQNGLFTDAGEIYNFAGLTAADPSNTLTLNIAVPGNALPGNTRMRVVMVETIDTGALPSSGIVGTYGEVEDYAITVTQYQYAWSATTAGGVTSGGLTGAAGTASSTNISTIATATATSSGTATYTVTISEPISGCTGTSSVLVNINAPSATPTVTASTQCGTNPANVQASSTTGGTFVWYDAETGGNVLQTDASTVLSILSTSTSSTTTYWVEFTDLTASCPSVRVPVVANITLAADAIITGPTTGFCGAANTSLTVSSSNAGYNYTWSTSETTTTINVSPATTTTYTVTATDGVCTDITSYTVTVSAPPSTTASSVPTTICAGNSVNLTASPANYLVSNPSFFVETPPATVNAGPVGDDVVQGPNAIGFNFNFYGVDYTNFGISTNGNIQLGSGAYSVGWTDVAIPNTAIPNNIISLAWDDWLTTANQITWWITGTPGSQRLVINFNTSGRGSGVADNINGQIILEEGTNNIYLSVVNKDVSTNTATQGIEDATGTNGIAVPGRNSVAWSASNSTYMFTPAFYVWSVLSTTGDATGGLPTGSETPALSNAAVTATPTATTGGTVTYQVSVTDPASGCVGTSTVTVTVNPPSATPTVTPSFQCGQGQATLIANSSVLSGTFNWYDTPTATTPINTETTTAGISLYTTALITGTTTYYVEFVDATNPCASARVPIIATVIPPEVITINTTPTVAAYCSTAPEVVTLTATSADPGYSYTWSPLAGLYTDAAMTIAYAGENLATVYTSPTSTTTYNVSGISGVCTGVASTTITVTPSPTVTATATPSTFCAGSSTTLSAAPPAPVYCPVVVSSSVDDDIASVTIGSYTNNSAGWPGAATTNAAATGTYTDNTALTTLTVTQGNTYPVSVTQFNSDISYPCFVSVYIDWNQNGILNDAGEVYDLGNTSAGTSIAGSIAVPATALNGKTRCRVYLREFGSATSNGPCNNFNWGEVEDYTLLVNYVPEYAWSVLSTTGDATGNLPAGSETPNVANANITTTPGGTAGGTVTYQVVASDPTSGCSASSQVVVTVNPIPTAPTTVNDTYCGVDNRSMTATSTFGNGIFNWYDAATGGSLLFSEGTAATGVSASTYTTLVSGTNSYWVDFTQNGCTSPRTQVTITVTTAGAITIGASPTTASCSTAGTPYTLTASSTDPYVYTWQYGATTFVGNPLVFTPTSTTTVTVTGFDAATSCSNVANYTVTITPAPAGTATAVPSVVCSGEDVALNVQLAGGSATVANYCTSAAQVNTFTDNIANVTFANINNNSANYPAGGALNNASANQLYTDYTSSVAAAVVLPGSTYPFSVTQYQTNGYYGTYTTVHIDWNHDNTFDATEIYDIGSAGVAGVAVTANITVPLTALGGATLMRVKMVEGGVAGQSACGTFLYGEVEDYTVLVNPYTYTWTATTAGGATDGGLPVSAATASGSNISLTASPTATSAGTVDYSVVITDPSTGCTNSSVVSVTVNPLPAPPSVPNLSICGAGSVTLSTAAVAAPGGIFTWYDAATGGTVLQTDGTVAAPALSSSYTTPTVTTSTSYWVTYTDAGGCQSSARQVEVSVTAADPVAIAAVGANPQCSNALSAVTLTASNTSAAPTNNYVYTWSTAETGATITVNPTATTTYTVTASDAATQCSYITNYTITVTPSPTVSASATPAAVCLGGSSNLDVLVNGAPTVIPAAGVAMPCSATSTLSSGDFIANVTLGSINNTTIATGTSYYNDYTATQSTTLASGTAYTINLQVGTWTADNYIGAWIDFNNNGSFTDPGEQIALSGALAGNAIYTSTFTVPTITVPTASVRMRVRETFGSVAAPCGSVTYGEVEDYTINLTGADYVFVWSNGATTSSQTVTPPVGANTYTVTVTSNGCAATASTTVTVNPLPLASVTPATATISCATPTVNLLASGGATYLWSTAETAANISVGTAGTYSVTVTSADGCTATASSVVSGSTTAPTVNAGPDRLLTCTTPSVTLTAVSPVTGATFAWNTGASTAAISATTAGTYTVTVTDPANSCTATDAVVVSANQTAPNLSVSPTAATLTCATTSATLVASSTTPGTTFAWSTGATTAAVTATTAGTYSVTVTSAINGCTSTASVAVSQDIAAPTVSIGTTTTTLTCATPSASLSTSGGGTYLWSTGATTSAISVSAAGTYGVTVTGTNGCSAASSVVISGNTTTPSVNAGADQTVACGATATLTATGSGTFAWNTGATTASITTATLSATTTYTVTVTGTNGCTASDAVVVSVLPCCAAQGGVVSVNTAICPGDPVVASVSGQNTDAVNYAFYYLLVNPATGAIVAYNTTGNFAGVTPGNYLIYGYSVKISSPVGGANPPANGTLLTALTGSCFDLSNTGAAITVPAPFPPFNGSVSDSQGSGGIEPFAYNIQVLTLSGGTLPYNFTWNNNGYVRYDIQYTATGATVTIYYADNATWACTVTDSNGCGATNLSFSNVIGSTGNPLVDIDNYVVTPQSNVLSPNGAINITVSGGGCTAGQYTYQWTGPNGFTASTEDITGLASGWYTVVVTCPLTGQTTTGWYWVPRQRRGRSKADDMLSLAVAPNPFTTNTTITWTTEEAGLTNVSVYSLDGKQVAELYNDLAAADEVYSLSFEAQNLTAGIYVVRITTASGAVQTAKLTLTK